MGKYARYERPPIKKLHKVHPIWRGIGCLMMIIIPTMSFFGAMGLVDYGVAHGWLIPPELLGRVQFPTWVWNVDILATLAAPIANFNNLYAVLAFFVVLLILFSGIYSTVYAIMYRAAGPSRYTPLDAPPSKHKPKAYKR